jgi:repressor LexA
MSITNKQQQVLHFIQRFIQQRGYGPTVREICRGLGLNSPGSLLKHLRALEREGVLVRTPGTTRTWRPAQAAPGPTVPVLGRIAAGAPLLAEENRDGELAIDPELFGCAEAFALRVEGDSMIDRHIQDGDLAVIAPDEEVGNGQVAAVMVEGLEAEATLKIWRRDGDRVELLAANPAYSPLVFTGPDLFRVKVLGRMVGLIRMGR